MSLHHTTAILAAGICILANPLQAKPRSCRIVFPERPQSAQKTAFVFDGSKSQSVTLPSMNLSEVIKLPHGELTIAMVPNEINDPKDLSPNAPILRIPEKVNEFYIILTSDPKNQDLPLKMNLVETEEGKLKPGETLWFNTTEHRILAKLGDNEMSVDPKGRTVSKDPVPATGYYIAKFAYQAEGKGPYAPITEQSWWHDTASRHLGFIVNSGGKLPKIYFYRDYRDPEPTEKGVDPKD